MSMLQPDQPLTPNPLLTRRNNNPLLRESAPAAFDPACNKSVKAWYVCGYGRLVKFVSVSEGLQVRLKPEIIT
jgi:hypothetical protein